GRGRRPNACEFGNQVSGPGTRVRQLRRCFSRHQWNVQFRCQLHLQLNRCRGSLRELDEPVGPVLASEWKYVLMESRDWPGFRSYQSGADFKRVRDLSRLLSHFYGLLRDVRVGTLRNGAVRIGSAADTRTRAVVTHILSEPDDLSIVGSDLRDRSSPH